MWGYTASILKLFDKYDMRLFELISEATATKPSSKPTINTTVLKNSLKKEIDSQILASNQHVAKKQSELDPDIVQDSNDDKNLNKIIPVVNKWLVEDLNYGISEGVSDILNAYSNDDSDVSFGSIGSSARAPGIDIEINDVYIKYIVQSVVDALYGYTLHSMDDEHGIVDTFFECLKHADLPILYGSRGADLEKSVNTLITVILHEFTHVLQNKAQYDKGRMSNEYRSYLEPNKEKFGDIINKASRGEQLTPTEYKIYRASPQEIPAYAQEAALNFINKEGVDKVTDFKKLRQELPKVFRTYVEKQFHDPTNSKEYQVFKKFHKLMYQEIVRYIDRREEIYRRSARRSVNAPVT